MPRDKLPWVKVPWVQKDWDKVPGDKGAWDQQSVYQCTRQHSIEYWRRTRFYRALNRMLFLAARPRERRKVMQRFYGLNDGLIARFYAGRSTLFDKTRILAGKPPVALTAAYRSVFGYRNPS